MHTPGLVIRFLEDGDRKIRLKDWRFIQTVDAIQKLFIMISAPCFDKVDWAHWRSFAHTLLQSHITLAREAPASSEQDKTERCACDGTQRLRSFFDHPYRWNPPERLFNPHRASLWAV